MSSNEQTFCEVHIEGRGGEHPCPHINFCCRTCLDIADCPKILHLRRNFPKNEWRACKYVGGKKCPYEMTFGEMAMEILKRRIFSDA